MYIYLIFKWIEFDGSVNTDIWYTNMGKGFRDNVGQFNMVVFAHVEVSDNRDSDAMHDSLVASHLTY